MLINTSTATVTYRLPAPLGHWVANVARLSVFGCEDGKCEGALLTSLSIDEDYPFECPPGLYGNTLDQAHQSSPQCSGPCPSGHFCPRVETTASSSGLGCIEPLPCDRGTYCVPGSPAPVPCPNGYYGTRPRLGSVDECVICPKGHWCRGGSATPCAEGTYNEFEGSASSDSCLPCPEFSITALGSATSRANCSCMTDFYLAPDGNCEQCPIGTSCQGDGDELFTLPVLPGYYRPSAASRQVWPCPDVETNCSALEQSCITTSGCRGGRNPALQCADGLTGKFCALCDENKRERDANDTTSTLNSSAASAVRDEPRRYYTPASTNTLPECKPCDASAGLTVLAAGGAGVAAILIAVGITKVILQCLSAQRKLDLLLAWENLSLMVKLKQAGKPRAPQTSPSPFACR